MHLDIIGTGSRIMRVNSNPEIPFLDRTLDYLFYASTLTLDGNYVRLDETQAISDHMPVVGVFTLP